MAAVRIASEAKHEVPEAALEDELTELRCPISYVAFDELDEGDKIVLGNDDKFYSQKHIQTHLTISQLSPFNRKFLTIQPLPSPFSNKLKSIAEEYAAKRNEWFTKLKNTEEKLSAAEVALVVNDFELQIITEELHKTKAALAAEREKKPITEKPLSFCDVSLPPAVSLRESRHNSLFLKAIIEANIAKIKYYARNGAYINTRNPETGETALIMAINLRFIHPEQAKEIILMLCDELKVDLNIKDFKGYTALHRAAARNDEWVTEFLLSKFADPLLTNDIGDTPRACGLHSNKDSFNKNINSMLEKHEKRCRLSTATTARLFRAVAPEEKKTTPVRSSITLDF